MKKLIGWVTLKRHCSYSHFNLGGYFCGYYHSRDKWEKCMAKNCPVWEKLKDEPAIREGV